jgi:hypothetical protein
MTESAQDNFERYFAEKLWDLIPEIYRHEDGLAANPGVLRAIVEIIAEQAAILRRSHDRLWEDQFIELCADWAVPYLGDLTATRLVSALTPRNRRVDVAKTIYYRRRKGTLRVLEELISDIAGWEGKVVEQFRRLARTRHGLDPRPMALAGRFSGTLPGGIADLRNPRATELTGTAFDEFFRTADVRRHTGVDGRFNIPKLAFHLFRLRAYRVQSATPFDAGDGLRFTCDPSGRDMALFSPRRRPEDWDDWKTARQEDLPGPIFCRIMGDVLPDAIVVEQAPDDPVAETDITAGDLSLWPIPDPGKRLVIDPEKGRLQFFGSPPAACSVTYHYGFSAEVGAGTYPRPEVDQRLPDSTVQPGGGPIDDAVLLENGITQIDDSVTYGPIANKSKVVDLTLQSASETRPYLRLAADWEFETDADADASLLLDGLWLGSEGKFAVILSGDYELVTIRQTTFDPGGDTDVAGNPIRPVPLIIEAKVETLVIDRCIMSRIATQNGGVVENLKINDSLLDAAGSGQMALDLPQGEVEMNRVTVFGQMDVNRLWASETLVTGVVDVTDTQSGCFRFSAAPAISRLPRPYESHPLTDSAHIFTSRRFGHPGYGQLSQTAPCTLTRGAENGSEIGVFSSLLNPIKHDSLRAKIDEYMPFGLIPIFIFET